MNAPDQTQVHTERTIAERSRLLLEIDNAIVSHLQLAPLLESISECLRRELPHDFAGLTIYDPEIRQLHLHSLDFSFDAPAFCTWGDRAHRLRRPKWTRMFSSWGQAQLG